MVTVLDNADREHLHHGRKFCWTVFLDNDQDGLLTSQRRTTRHYVPPEMMQQEVYSTIYDIVVPKNKPESGQTSGSNNQFIGNIKGRGAS